MYFGLYDCPVILLLFRQPFFQCYLSSGLVSHKRTFSEAGSPSCRPGNGADELKGTDCR